MRGGRRRRAHFALWAAGALLSACEHWCAAEYSCSGESCGDCPGCTPPTNASVEAVNTTLAACPIEPPADRAAARVGCILVAALAGFIVVVALVWRPSRKGCSGERVGRCATLLSSSLLVCGSSLLIVFLVAVRRSQSFTPASAAAPPTSSRPRRSASGGSAAEDTPTIRHGRRRPTRSRVAHRASSHAARSRRARRCDRRARRHHRCRGRRHRRSQGLRRSASDGALAALGRSFVGLVRSPSQKSFTKGAEGSSSPDDV